MFSNSKESFLPLSYFLLQIDGVIVYLNEEQELHVDLPFMKSEKFKSLIGVSPKLITFSCSTLLSFVELLKVLLKVFALTPNKLSFPKLLITTSLLADPDCYNLCLKALLVLGFSCIYSFIVSLGLTLDTTALAYLESASTNYSYFFICNNPL